MMRIKHIFFLVSVALMLPSVSAFAAEPVKLEDETARTSYSLGYQIGGDFKRQGTELNNAAVIKGIEDALSGTAPQISQKDMNTILRELKRKVIAKQRDNRRNSELRYIAEGKKFLQENAAKEGVKTTASGLQYMILEPGKGKTPKPTDEVTVNYRGTMINGNEFDSSYSRGEPSKFRLNGVIKGWTEGLQLISEGGKIRLFIPPELAYNARGPLAHRTLIFDVDLVSVGDQKQTSQAKPSAPDTQQ